MAKAKEVFYIILGILAWAALAVFIYTTFIQDWGSTSGGYDSGDIGCTRAGDCY